MNAAEHIVESYFRLVRKCFTLVDVKVESGNNRQLDILAYDVIYEHAYHIEVGVTHRENWCPTVDQLSPHFEKKFFGKPPERKSKNGGKTDHDRKKSYWPQITSTYESVGLQPELIQRVWVCWTLKQPSETKTTRHQYKSIQRLSAS